MEATYELADRSTLDRHRVDRAGMRDRRQNDEHRRGLRPEGRTMGGCLRHVRAWLRRRRILNRRYIPPPPPPPPLPAGRASEIGSGRLGPLFAACWRHSTMDRPSDVPLYQKVMRPSGCTRLSSAPFTL